MEILVALNQQTDVEALAVSLMPFGFTPEHLDPGRQTPTGDGGNGRTRGKRRGEENEGKRKKKGGF